MCVEGFRHLLAPAIRDCERVSKGPRFRKQHSPAEAIEHTDTSRTYEFHFPIARKSREPRLLSMWRGGRLGHNRTGQSGTVKTEVVLDRFARACRLLRSPQRTQSSVLEPLLY